MDPYRHEAWRAEAPARRIPDCRPGIFEHWKHSVWLLWHLNSVWCLDSTQQSGGSQQKGAGSQLWGTGSVIRGSGSQTRGAGSEIRWDPSQFNRCYTNIYRIVNTPLVSTHLHSRIRKRVFRTSVCVQFVFVCWERAFTLPGHIMPNSHRPPDTTRQSCLCSVRRGGVWVSFKSRITWMAHGIV